VKVVVISSDKYINVLNGFSVLFNRHWSENKQVDVLCYKKPDFNLPDNFNLISVGNKCTDDWSTALIPYFETMEDEYFLLCLEDHLMYKDIDFDLLDKAEEYIKDPKIAKVMCNFDPRINREEPGEDYCDDFYRWSLPATKGNNKGPVSLCVSIWKKDFFLSLLKPGMNIRDFENIPKPNDPRHTLFPKNDFVYPQLDACRSGEFNNVVLSEGYRGSEGQYVDELDRGVFEQTRRDLYDPSNIRTSKYYGQWETDRIIERYFDEDYIGTCIEVGAADGIKGSNTMWFEDSGWKTLCIEANPLFKDSLHDKRKEVVISAVGTSESNSADFNVFVVGNNNIMTSISGLVVDDKLVESHKHLIKDSYKIKVPVKRLDSLLEEKGYPREIDFISIDTESTELDVLKSLDLSEWYVKLLVVENNHNDPAIEEYLTQFGYKKDRRYRVNDFYVRSNL
jgi:FkbM family methyltransferase